MLLERKTLFFFSFSFGIVMYNTWNTCETLYFYEAFPHVHPHFVSIKRTWNPGMIYVLAETHSTKTRFSKISTVLLAPHGCPRKDRREPTGERPCHHPGDRDGKPTRHHLPGRLPWLLLQGHWQRALVISQTKVHPSLWVEITIYVPHFAQKKGTSSFMFKYDLLNYNLHH